MPKPITPLKPGLLSGLILLLLLCACGTSDSSPATSPDTSASRTSSTETTRLTGFSGKATEVARISSSQPTIVAKTAPSTRPVVSPSLPTNTASLAISPPVSPSTVSRLRAGNIIFTLLLNNHLLAFGLDDGTKLADISLGSNPPPVTPRAPGHYLAFSQDHKTLFSLVPGWNNEPDRVAILDVATAQVKATYQLSQSEGRLSGLGFASNVYRTLLVGPKSGKLYLVGNRFGTVVVTVLDPQNGTEVKSWTARERDGKNWLVYQAELSDDESQLYISYHGDNTSGIDRFDLRQDPPQRCPQTRADWGCLGAHGGFAFYNNNLLVGYGYQVVVELDSNGVARYGYDTGLPDSHITEFVLDRQAALLYTVTTCLAPESVRGGFSVIDLANSAMPNLATIPGDQQWRSDPPLPKVRVTPGPSQGGVNSPVPCGERLSLSPDARQVVVAQPKIGSNYLIQASIPGAVLVVDSRTGQVQRSISTTSAPADLITIGLP